MPLNKVVLYKYLAILGMAAPNSTWIRVCCIELSLTESGIDEKIIV